ncbi:LexA family protein [Agathobaculum desmolans]|uniref:LexA family protein n=1 Tax=Agathobaculum desmolans TaxID=39484 RepID=UPI00248DB6D2|nr:LexA family transcriptional regulator [Agathobaculum desmolans]
MTTGERMKSRRKELGLSADDVAAALNVSRATIFRYEKGEIEKVPGAMLEPLATALHTTPAYLMGWEEPSSPKPSLPTDAFPIDFSHLQRIPILGRIAAGMPIYAEENIEGYTYTDLNGGGEYFGLRVRGDSMDAARINDGDIVIIRRQDIVENGEIAAVLIDGQDATLKRFSRHGNIVTLMPQSTNPANQPFIYDLTETTVKILGLVVKVEFRPQ